LARDEESDDEDKLLHLAPLKSVQVDSDLATKFFC
jgi:hypothetical protein